MGSDASKLRAAAKAGDEAELRRIIEKTSPEQLSKLMSAAAWHNGKAAIHYASTYGHSEAIRILLEQGHADPNQAVKANLIPKYRGSDGRTAIVLASKHTHSNSIITLAKLGANPDAAISSGFHATAIAIESGDFSTFCALMEAGSNPRLPEPKTQLEPIQLAANADRADMVGCLLDWGASPDGAEGVGGEDRPIHIGARKSNTAMVTHLLAYGADPDRTGANSVTPLLHAIDKGSYATARALLMAGANPRLTTRNAEPIVLAASARRGVIVSLLAAHGADLNAVDFAGRATALHLCAAAGLIGAVNDLLLFGAMLDPVRGDGFTPLHACVAAGHENVAMALCNVGANAQARDSRGRTPLHLTQHGNGSLTALLLAYGADANAQDAGGQCPAGAALYDFAPSVFSALLPFTSPALLNPLFHYAVDNVNERAVQMMLLAVRVAAPDVYSASTRVGMHKQATEQSLYM